MSSYGGRRAPNFAQYLEDLNTIPSPYDQAMQQQQQETESFNIDAELALFTNTEFLDFGPFGDMTMPVGYNAVEDESKAQGQTDVAEKQQEVNIDYMDLLNDLGNIPDSTTQFASDVSNDSQHVKLLPSAQATTQFVPHNRALEQSYVPQSAEQALAPKTEIEIPSSNNVSSSSSTSSSFVSTPMQVAGTKRKQSQQSQQSQQDAKSLDEAARAAAEEDKRRRNTAASARFRVKKKQREQALEKSVKEANERNAALEARVSQLELENQWLKNLITEKNDAESSAAEGGGGGGKQQQQSTASRSETDIAHMFKNFLASQNAGKEQSSDSKIGVSTA